MQQVKSSLIKAIGYDEERELLTITFKAGGTFEYALITPELWKDFKEAPSIGKYFVANIKGQFPTKNTAC